MKREIAAVLTCVAFVPGCGLFQAVLCARQPLPTVPGPESPELVRSTRLQLVEMRAESELLLRKLSDGSVTRLELSHPVRELSGPDREGRVVYLTTPGSRRSTRVWIESLDPSPPVQAFPLEPGEEHFSIGYFELSPVGGRLAFRSTRATGVEALEVLDLESGEVRTLRTGRCPDFAWFPDGVRLVFTEFEESGSGKGTMHIVDCASGASLNCWDLKSFLQGLWVGPEGKDIYSATGSDRALWRLDLATGQHGSWSLPGLGFPIAFSGDGMVVGLALPTEGAKQEYATSLIYGSTPKYAVKLFDLATGAFCTVAPQVGRFDDISAVETGP